MNCEWIVHNRNEWIVYIQTRLVQLTESRIISEWQLKCNSFSPRCTCWIDYFCVPFILTVWKMPIILFQISLFVYNGRRTSYKKLFIFGQTLTSLNLVCRKTKTPYMKFSTKSSSRLRSACTASLKWREVGKSQHKVFGLTIKRSFNSLGMNWRCQSVFNKSLWNTMQRAMIFSRGGKNSLLQALLQCRTLLQRFITLYGVIFKKGPLQ